MEQGHFLSAGSAGHPRLTRDALIRALDAGCGGERRSDILTARRLAAKSGAHADFDGHTAPLMQAAVLVPLVARPEGLTVLLTQRTAHLHNHGGQISFPGGRLEPGDADPQAAALRETEEEIGLSRGAIDVIGRLDDYATITGFHITPVVGLLSPPLALAPDDFEVAEVFEVPLSFIMDPANHKTDSRMLPSGETRWFYVIPYQQRYIWGATAGMLVNLYEVLSGLWKG
ncbi:MAG TPA: CoA pyrophosphatase [Magnetospirillaceae bacterium]|nr:CoA pyrophosphatase [Magnetospirillaceae bacterium]